MTQCYFARLDSMAYCKSLYHSSLVASQVDGDISGERKLAAVGHLLNRRHGGRFMVWNLSEVDYDVDILDDQVLAFTFAGSPSPPLGLLLKLLMSMESWLKADERNVAVVHCLTGKGRTSSVVGAFLSWMKEAQFADIFDALTYIAACKQIPVEELTIPSQRRYASYFKNMLDGVRPSQPPLMLKRVIMSEAPRFAKGPPRPTSPEDGEKKIKNDNDESQLMGCVPYLQIFKAGKLLHTAPASLHFQQAENELPFCQVADGSISFHINLVVQGDILVRARHLTHNKKRISMFRAAFHTGYTPPNVMRFTKSQLDGACSDDRFVPDFFLDFIFEPVDVEEASKLLANAHFDQTDAELLGTATKIDSKKRADAVEATPDDTMLHRDSRFWEVIASRMKENAADTKEKEDPNWGPTVGRRRDFAVKTGEDGQSDAEQAAPEQVRNALESFSIGGEFDFLPQAGEPMPSQPPMSPSPTHKAAPKKDSLLEALMGALDDDHDNDMDQDVVEFESEEALKVSAAETPKASSAIAAVGSEGQASAAAATEANAKDDRAEGSVAASSSDDIQALLADANMNLDDDMDALLASAGDAVSDDDMLNFDVDDAELKDLESFLSSAK
jgi:C2 domain of PTEN tumour-suppressor protein